VSIVISLFALAISLLTLYWGHIYTSEDVYVSISDYSYLFKSEDINIDIVLINEGNQPIIISKISFGFCYEKPDCLRNYKGPLIYAKKWNVDEFAYPFYLSPTKMETLKLNLNLGVRALDPIRLTFQSRELPNPPDPPKPVVERSLKQDLAERSQPVYLLLIFDTIGPSLDHQTVKVLVMTIYFRNGNVYSYGSPDFSPNWVITRIRSSGLNITRFLERVLHRRGDELRLNKSYQSPFGTFASTIQFYLRPRAATAIATSFAPGCRWRCVVGDV
jgi:hypothetical protein